MEFQFSDGRVFALDEQQKVIAEATYVPVYCNIVDTCHTYIGPALCGRNSL